MTLRDRNHSDISHWTYPLNGVISSSLSFSTHVRWHRANFQDLGFSSGHQRSNRGRLQSNKFPWESWGAKVKRNIMPTPEDRIAALIRYYLRLGAMVIIPSAITWTIFLLSRFFNIFPGRSPSRHRTATRTSWRSSRPRTTGAGTNRLARGQSRVESSSKSP